MTDDFPETPAGKPLWLMTLADLGLLLVGFFVLVHATRHDASGAIAGGLRARFGGEATAVPAAAPAPMPVAAAGMMNFAPGSALLPTPPEGLIAWAREAARDPRVTLTVTGSTDGSAADRDPATGSAALLALDRARATAAPLAAALPGSRLIITTTTRRAAPGSSGRAALVTLAFTGDRT